MEKLKPRVGRPPLLEDEKLIAEKTRKARARAADKIARKEEQLVDKLLAIATADKTSTPHFLSAFKELRKVQDDFLAKALEDQPEEVVEEDKPDIPQPLRQVK